MFWVDFVPKSTKLHLSPAVGQRDVFHLIGGFEQGRNLFVGEARYTATDTGDAEEQFGMLLGVRDKLIHVRTDCLNTALHGRNGITLPGATDTDAHFCAKELVRRTRRTSAMHSGEVAAKDEYLIRLETCDIFRCNTHERLN